MLKNKKRFTLLVCGLLIFTMFFCSAFAYASWYSTLTASGAVAATGNFDVYFGKGKNSYYNSNEVISDITGDINEVKVSNNGASENYDSISLDIKVLSNFNTGTFKIKVYNNGTVDAVVSGAPTVFANSNDNRFRLTTTLATIPAQSSGELTVTLSKSSVTLVPGNTSNIVLTLKYEQPTVSGTPTATHSHS